ncbi:ABC transporter ATP-binding protein [Marinobacter sp. Z-F4-2]|nr:ABC transporter ATP-binding protein [Marinobacter sp. Z-F4-2]|tara:strand:+ start:71 stop:772 length:702 start_codon:yes stop_codon:yes gene_type:complete
MLELRDISVSYGAIDAVKRVDLSAAPGTITALIGANGAGKSSLLKAVSGLVKPKTGQILLDGYDIGALQPHERARLGIAHALEGRRLFHQHTVEENLVTAWHFRHPSGDFKRAVDQVYANFPILAERRRLKAGTLSGGQQQMLILSMATLHEPRLVLLDEPSLGLAPIIVSQIYEFIRGYCDEGGRTVVLSEQMASLALKVADQGYVLRQGEVVQSGESAKLKGDGLAGAYLG